MSKKHKRIIKIIAALIVIMPCFWIATQNRDFLSKIGTVITPPPTEDPLEAQLNEAALQYEKREIDLIDLSSITTFSWDRLYIFGDAVSILKVESIVGSSWKNDSNCYYVVYSASINNYFTLMVFSNQGIVVHCLAHEKNTYPLFGLSQGFNDSGYSPEEALFVLNEEGHMILKENK